MLLVWDFSSCENIHFYFLFLTPEDFGWGVPVAITCSYRTRERVVKLMLLEHSRKELWVEWEALFTLVTSMANLHARFWQKLITRTFFSLIPDCKLLYQARWPSALQSVLPRTPQKLACTALLRITSYFYSCCLQNHRSASIIRTYSILCRAGKQTRCAEHSSTYSDTICQVKFESAHASLSCPKQECSVAHQLESVSAGCIIALKCFVKQLVIRKCGGDQSGLMLLWKKI